MDKFEKNQQNQKEKAPRFDYEKYSVASGTFGLFLAMFFFPSGMYPAFFLGVVGFTCALIARRTSGKNCLAGLILCGFSVALSLLLFFSLFCFYEAIRDPVMGPRFSQLFMQLIQDRGISTEGLMEIMGS